MVTNAVSKFIISKEICPGGNKIYYQDIYLGLTCSNYLPNMTWSIYRLISVMQHPTIEDLLNPYNDIQGIDIMYQEHNYSFSSDSSL